MTPEPAKPTVADAGPARDYARPSVRPLAVFAFDPTLGRTLNNHMTLQVPYEELQPGPIGRKIAVVDYDASNGLWYEPVDLDHKHVSLRGGLDPAEGDPRFHQQMVYAVASETIRRFEVALGREVKWRPKPGTKKEQPFRAHLRIFPHAIQQANAFFDPKLNALVFGYFSADAMESGPNLPDQTVFTCLSHDIVAHETTHAIIHSIRDRFSEPTSQDTPAFHEAFADIVALFQHFSVREALTDTIRRTGGDLFRRNLRSDAAASTGGNAGAVSVELTGDNPLVGLAQQFGQALGLRQALRQALGSKPDPRELARTTEAHARGAILVAAVFDAFFSVYIRRTRPLMRIARAAGTFADGGDLHPDLVDLLAEQASKIAGRFLTICIRAIDYCPPVDIQFGEFLRAMVTADSVLVPEDPHGYRAALIDGFRRRGIVPEGVKSFSEEALRWCSPADRSHAVPPIQGLDYQEPRETTQRASDHNEDARKRNAIILHAYAQAHAADLGLVPNRGGKVVVQPHSFHPVYRIGPDGRMLTEFVAEYVQMASHRIDPNDIASAAFTMYGGSTVIFDSHGTVRYVIDKPLDSEARLARQRAYLTDQSASSAFTGPSAGGLSFAAIHRGC